MKSRVTGIYGIRIYSRSENDTQRTSSAPGGRAPPSTTYSLPSPERMGSDRITGF